MNNDLIFEGDILKGEEYPYRSGDDYNYFAEVLRCSNCPAMGIYTIKNPTSNVRGISEGNTEIMEEWIIADWEIIGNIFDNPELTNR